MCTMIINSDEIHNIEGQLTDNKFFAISTDKRIGKRRVGMFRWQNKDGS